eukprot:753777-Hanusia_phi.AAC.1
MSERRQPISESMVDVLFKESLAVIMLAYRSAPTKTFGMSQRLAPSTHPSQSIPTINPDSLPCRASDCACVPSAKMFTGAAKILRSVLQHALSAAERVRGELSLSSGSGNRDLKWE